MEKIVERIDKAIIAGAEGITALDLNDNTDLIDDLSFDSINIISLVVNLETEFNIEIPDNFLLLERLRSYRQIKELVFSLVEKRELLCNKGVEDV